MCSASCVTHLHVRLAPGAHPIHTTRAARRVRTTASVAWGRGAEAVRRGRPHVGCAGAHHHAPVRARVLCGTHVQRARAHTHTHTPRRWCCSRGVCCTGANTTSHLTPSHASNEHRQVPCALRHTGRGSRAAACTRRSGANCEARAHVHAPSQRVLHNRVRGAHTQPVPTPHAHAGGARHVPASVALPHTAAPHRHVV